MRLFKTHMKILWILIYAMLMLISCGQEKKADTKKSICIFGTTKDCTCSNNQTGNQTCKEDESGWVECDCINPEIIKHDDVDHFKNAEEMLTFAGTFSQQNPAQIKFIITSFQSTNNYNTFYLNPRVYSLHDQWYWFRLMNGNETPGIDLHEPVNGLNFTNTNEITEFCKNLPPECTSIGLEYRSDRLYSPDFYDLGIHVEPKQLGLGSILYFPENPERVESEELWLFELEYLDNINVSILKQFFKLLESNLPDEVGSKLKWLARSAYQMNLIDQMKMNEDPYSDRLMKYSDLVIPDSYNIYNNGITAGYVKIVESDESLSELRPEVKEKSDKS